MKLRLFVYSIGIACMFMTSDILAQPEGQEIFERMKCFKCHDPEYNKLGPPLKLIAGIYETGEKLVSYFNGEMESIVKPEMAEVMEEGLLEISRLSDQEKASLAGFIMRHK